MKIHVFCYNCSWSNPEGVPEKMQGDSICYENVPERTQSRDYTCLKCARIVSVMIDFKEKE